MPDQRSPETTGWHSIESAPQDGREALLWKPQLNALLASEPDDWGYVLGVMDVEPSWWAERGYTRWMPLPEPPHAE